MKLLTILLTIFLTFSIVSSPQAEMVKKAPLPHYSDAIGYGWQATIPVKLVNILKAWENTAGIYAFFDEDLDGVCDVVYVWLKAGERGADGLSPVFPAPDQSCEDTEKQIADFLGKHSK